MGSCAGSTHLYLIKHAEENIKSKAKSDFTFFVFLFTPYPIFFFIYI